MGCHVPTSRLSSRMLRLFSSLISMHLPPVRTTPLVQALLWNFDRKIILSAPSPNFSQLAATIYRIQVLLSLIHI